MAAFDFPNSPNVNDTYSANGMTFTWNGTKWENKLTLPLTSHIIKTTLF